MKSHIVIFSYIILLCVSCKNNKLPFESFWAAIKVSDIKTIYNDNSNVHRRNNVFQYYEKETLIANYVLNTDGIRLLESTVRDTVSLKKKIKAIINIQEKLHISGFRSSDGNFKVYFNLEDISSVPFVKDKNDNQGILMYFKDIGSKQANISDYKRLDSHWYGSTTRIVTNAPEY